MFEKLQYKGPLIIASSLFFGFIFYVGLRIQSGENLSGSRGIMRWIAETLNGFADMFGPAIAGYGLMSSALFGGVFAAVFIWRDPMM